MGYGYDKETAKENHDKMKAKYRNEEVKAIVRRLKSHPNYKDQTPNEGESQIDFTLRVIAHMVSPPMEDEEDTTIECTDLAGAIRAMSDELKETWTKYHHP
jgi:hypothetical protein